MRKPFHLVLPRHLRSETYHCGAVNLLDGRRQVARRRALDQLRGQHLPETALHHLRKPLALLLLCHDVQQLVPAQPPVLQQRLCIHRDSSADVCLSAQNINKIKCRTQKFERAHTLVIWAVTPATGFPWSAKSLWTRRNTYGFLLAQLLRSPPCTGL